MTNHPLYYSAQGTASATGIGRATLGPNKAFEKWKVSRISVQSTSTVLTPTAKVYRGAVSPSRLIEGTYSGNLDSSDTSLLLQTSEQMVVEWVGCDVGAICTVVVEGERLQV